MKFGGFSNLLNNNKISMQNVVKANKSDDIMISILIGIVVIFCIFLMYRYYKYNKLSCPPGLKPTPFTIYSITGQACVPALKADQLQKMTPSISDNNKPRSYSLIPGTLSNISMEKTITPQNVSDEVPLPTGTTKEVYHIADQDFTYEQARCKCASYGARLATFDEMVDAYNKGADWCSYGWSEGQKAYYPTQKCSWDKLQTGPKEMRNMCGMPGVNGGFFPSPNMKFGANCYGVKPKGRVVKQKAATCDTGVCERPGNANASTRKTTDNIVAFNNDQWNE